MAEGDAIMTNSGFYFEHYMRMAKDDNYSIRAKLAYSQNCPQEAFVLLRNDPDAYVRCCLAANPRCPVDTLLTLNNDRTENVRLCVLSNPNCPEWLKVMAS